MWRVSRVYKIFGLAFLPWGMGTTKAMPYRTVLKSKLFIVELKNRFCVCIFLMRNIFLLKSIERYPYSVFLSSLRYVTYHSFIVLKQFFAFGYRISFNMTHEERRRERIWNELNTVRHGKRVHLWICSLYRYCLARRAYFF